MNTMKPLPLQKMLPAPQEVIEAICVNLKAGILSIDALAAEIERRSLDWYREHGYEIHDR